MTKEIDDLVEEESIAETVSKGRQKAARNIDDLISKRVSRGQSPDPKRAPKKKQSTISRNDVERRAAVAEDSLRRDTERIRKMPRPNKSPDAGTNRAQEVSPDAVNRTEDGRVSNPRVPEAMFRAADNNPAVKALADSRVDLMYGKGKSKLTSRDAQQRVAGLRRGIDGSRGPRRTVTTTTIQTRRGLAGNPEGLMVVPVTKPESYQLDNARKEWRKSIPESTLAEAEDHVDGTTNFDSVRDALLKSGTEKGLTGKALSKHVSTGTKQHRQRLIEDKVQETYKYTAGFEVAREGTPEQRKADGEEADGTSRLGGDWARAGERKAAEIEAAGGQADPLELGVVASKLGSQLLRTDRTTRSLMTAPFPEAKDAGTVRRRYTASDENDDVVNESISGGVDPEAGLTKVLEGDSSRDPSDPLSGAKSVKLNDAPDVQVTDKLDQAQVTDKLDQAQGRVKQSQAQARAATQQKNRERARSGLAVAEGVGQAGRNVVVTAGERRQRSSSMAKRTATPQERADSFGLLDGTESPEEVTRLGDVAEAMGKAEVERLASRAPSSSADSTRDGILIDSQRREITGDDAETPAPLTKRQKMTLAQNAAMSKAATQKSIEVGRQVQEDEAIKQQNRGSGVDNAAVAGPLANNSGVPRTGYGAAVDSVYLNQGQRVVGSRLLRSGTPAQTATTSLTRAYPELVPDDMFKSREAQVRIDSNNRAVKSGDPRVKEWGTPRQSKAWGALIGRREEAQSSIDADKSLRTMPSDPGRKVPGLLGGARVITPQEQSDTVQPAPSYPSADRKPLTGIRDDASVIPKYVMSDIHSGGLPEGRLEVRQTGMRAVKNQSIGKQQTAEVKLDRQAEVRPWANPRDMYRGGSGNNYGLTDQAVREVGAAATKEIRSGYRRSSAFAGTHQASIEQTARTKKNIIEARGLNPELADDDK